MTEKMKKRFGFCGFRKVTWKGSYTVEAAFIFSMLFLVIAMVLQWSLDLYQQTEQISSQIQQEETLPTLKYFCKKEEWNHVKEIIFQ